MFSRDHPDTCVVLIEDLHPVRPEIDPSGLRTFRDYTVCRTDIASAIFLIIFGNGEFQEIDLISPVDILLTGACCNLYRGIFAFIVLCIHSLATPMTLKFRGRSRATANLLGVARALQKTGVE